MRVFVSPRGLLFFFPPLGFAILLVLLWRSVLIACRYLCTYDFALDAVIARQTLNLLTLCVLRVDFGGGGPELFHFNLRWVFPIGVSYGMWTVRVLKFLFIDVGWFVCVNLLGCAFSSPQ